MNSVFITGIFSPGSSGPGEEVADIVLEPLEEGPWSFDCWLVSTWSEGGEGEALRLTDADDRIGVKFFEALAGDLESRKLIYLKIVHTEIDFNIQIQTYASLSRFLKILGRGDEFNFDTEVSGLSLIIKAEFSLEKLGWTDTAVWSTIITELNLICWGAAINPIGNKIKIK